MVAIGDDAPPVEMNGVTRDAVVANRCWDDEHEFMALNSSDIDDDDGLYRCCDNGDDTYLLPPTPLTSPVLTDDEAEDESGIMAPDAALFRLREHEAPPVTNEFFLLVSKDVGVMGDDGEENRPDDVDDDDGEDDNVELDDGGEDSDRLRTVLCNDDGMAIAPGSTLRVSVGELVAPVPVPVVVAVVAAVAVVPVVEVLRNGVGVGDDGLLVIDDSTTTTAVAVNSPVLLLLLLVIAPFVLIDTNVGLVGDDDDDTPVLLNTFPLLATVVVVANEPPLLLLLLLLLLMFSLAQPPPPPPTPTITTSFSFRSFLFVLSLVFENQLFSWIMVSPVMALNCSFWACDGYG